MHDLQYIELLLSFSLVHKKFMNPNLRSKISFTAARNTSETSHRFFGNEYEGQIITLPDSDGDSASSEVEKFRISRMKRMKGRDRFEEGFASSSISRTSESFYGGAHPRDSRSIRSHQFSDLPYDDEDYDFPPPPGTVKNISYHMDDDPSMISTENVPASTLEGQPDVVDVDAESVRPRSTVGYTPPAPIPPLADVMASFKLRVAAKKAEMNDLMTLKDQTHQRIQSLQSELISVKAQIDSARERYDFLNSPSMDS